MPSYQLRATAVCIGPCGLLGEGSWEACDKAAEKHVKPGHATACRVVAR